MKAVAAGLNIHVLRAKKLLLSVIVIICSTIAIWVWQKPQLMAIFPPSQVRLDIANPQAINLGSGVVDPGEIGIPPSHRDENHTADVGREEHEIRIAQVSPATPPPGTTPLPVAPTPTVNPLGATPAAPAPEVNNPSGTTPVASKAPTPKVNHSPTVNPSGTITDDKDVVPLQAKKKDCNYARGRWVADSNRPLYSGFQCKRWLSSMWACRLMHRKDFSYEGFRWQPEDGCHMPDFQPSAFLNKMKHKALAFVGDSLGRQQFQSLMCMLTAGNPSPYVNDVGRHYGLAKPRRATRPPGWAYRFPSTNTTVLFYWSTTLCDLHTLNASDHNTPIAMHLDRPAAFLRRHIPAIDVLVLNTGHHWNRGKLKDNRWVMHLKGRPVPSMNVWRARNVTVHSVARWVGNELRGGQRAFWRTVSPRHFVGGEWNSRGRCDKTTPLVRGAEVGEGAPTGDEMAEGAVRGTRVELLDVTALSRLRDEGHIANYSRRGGGYDCLHWCLPGVPDAWNEILFARI